MSSLVHHHSPILRNNQTFPSTTHHSNSTISFTTNPNQSLSKSFSLFHPNSLSPKRSLCAPPFLSIHQHNTSDYNTSKIHFILESLILCIFSLTLLYLRLVSNVLLPDFPNRWNQLISFSEDTEEKFIHYPPHLWQSIVANEDRRFFTHFGIDPVGITRAVLSFSALGGGSTITQQLVKNTFLKNERTLTRKIVEIVLALALERSLSKLKILSSYLSKIYWGHGIYGIDSASNFYFGKHPTLLGLGECAMLAGIIPSPEFRSPLRDCSRGKRYQARVLKRMVEVGFLDIEKALLVVKQSLHLRVHAPEYVDGLLILPSSSRKKEFKDLTVKVIWDWEKESKIWEAVEDMERWAVTVSNQKRTQIVISGSKIQVEEIQWLSNSKTN